MAESYAKALQFDKSIESSHAAVAVYDEILRGAPEDHTVHSNKARALAFLADSLSARREASSASSVLAQAAAAADEALRLAPEDIWARNSKAICHAYLGSIGGTSRPAQGGTLLRRNAETM